jgi:hypothetical protein
VSESEIKAVLAELKQRMGEVRASVAALQAVLTSAPEVQSDQPDTP